ncbi:MAG TPA: small multi-drug export protein [Pseudogracilibacillus sp.]|nr:small multi-drug export protein [Pseudogracilibacillus sp.]
MENIFLQYAVIFFGSMVPFLEVFVSIPMGVVGFGLPLFVVLLISIVGNMFSVFLFIFFGTEINKFMTKFRKTNQPVKKINPKIKETFDRFGATGVSFLSSLLFSSQIGAGTMITLGASKLRVFFWTCAGVSILAGIMAVLSVTAEELVISLIN